MPASFGQPACLLLPPVNEPAYLPRGGREATGGFGDAGGKAMAHGSGARSTEILARLCTPKERSFHQTFSIRSHS